MNSLNLRTTAIVACLSAALLMGGPLSAREVGEVSGCIGEESRQLPGTLQIEGASRHVTIGGEGRPDPDFESTAEESQDDCALA